MPRIELEHGDRVRTDPLPRLRESARPPRPTPDAFGASFGAGLAQAGLALGQEVARIREEQRQKADEFFELTTTRGFNQLHQIQGLSQDRGPSLDPAKPNTTGSKGLFTMTGMEVQEKLDDNLAEWDRQADMLVTQAKTPSQRLIAERIRDDARARYVDAGMKHATAETAKARSGAINAGLASSIELAGSVAGTPGGLEIIARELQWQTDHLTKFGKEVGLHTPEQVKEAIAKAHSASHVLAVNHLLSSGKPLAAQEYFDRVMPEGNPQILESQAAPLRAKLKESTPDAQGYADAQAIWEADGPKPGETGPIKIADMTAKARALAGKDQKRYDAARTHLLRFEADHQGQTTNVQKDAANTLWTARTQGRSLTQLMGMGAWNQVPGTEREALMDAYQADADRLRSIQRQNEDDARQRRGEARTEQAYQEAQFKKGSEALYWRLAGNPARLARLEASDLGHAEHQMTPEDFARLKAAQAALQGNQGELDAVTIERGVLDQVLTQAGHGWIKTPIEDMSEDQQQRAGNVLIAVEKALRDAQHAKGRKLGPNEQREVIQGVVDQKVAISGEWYGVSHETAALVSSDDAGRMRAEWKTIPAWAKANMRTVIRNEPTRAGVVSTRTLRDPEIDMWYWAAMERAYAVHLRGGGEEAWKAILREAVNARKDVTGTTTRPTPARPRPVPAHPTPPAPRRVVPPIGQD